MIRYYCPYCCPKYEFHIKRNDGMLVCGQCGDPLIKRSLIKPIQIFAIISALAFTTPLIMMVFSFIKHHEVVPLKESQSIIGILIRSKQRLRYLFISNYRAVAWSTFVSRDQIKPREKARRSLKEKLEGNKKSRASRRAGWRRGRRIVSRPYDMYGEIEEPPDGVD